MLTYAYDENGNVVRETGYGFTRTTEYDALDRVKAVTFNFGNFSKTVQYTYDAADNRKTIVYPSGLTLTYVWDTANRLVSISAPGQTWSFLYDKDGRLMTVRHPNGLELNATYDDASRVQTLRSRNPSSGILLEGYAFTHDRVGNRLTVLQEHNGTTLTYQYLKDYRLNRTAYEGAVHNSTYTYDPNGNRLSKVANSPTVENWTYAYNDDASLRSYDLRVDGTLRLQVLYTYDRNGNLKSKVENVPKRGQTTYTYAYDLEDRLVRVVVEGVEKASYAYFTDGARIRKTVDNTTTTYYLYDPWDFSGFNDILEEYDSSGGLLARYTLTSIRVSLTVAWAAAHCRPGLWFALEIAYLSA